MNFAPVSKVGVSRRQSRWKHCQLSEEMDFSISRGRCFAGSLRNFVWRPAEPNRSEVVAVPPARPVVMRCQSPVQFRCLEHSSVSRVRGPLVTESKRVCQGSQPEAG